jgi:hypothetical protein
MKSTKIEQGAIYQGECGQLREVVDLFNDEFTHIPQLHYRMRFRGSGLGSGCPQEGQTVRMTLKRFAYWAQEDVTEHVPMAGNHARVTREGVRA